jgi:hypothetical protein
MYKSFITKNLTVVLLAFFGFFLNCKESKEEVPSLVRNDNGQFYVYSQTSLNLREKPDKSSASLGQIWRATNVEFLDSSGVQETISGIKGEWWRVKAEGKEGYMFSGYLSRFKHPQKDCYGLDSYLQETYGEWSEKNRNVKSYKKDDSACKQMPEDAEGCHIITTYETLDGISAKVETGYEWGREEIFFPKMNDGEGYLLLRECCSKSNPIQYSDYINALHGTGEIPEVEDGYYVKCNAKRESKGIRLLIEIGV